LRTGDGRFNRSVITESQLNVEGYGNLSETGVHEISIKKENNILNASVIS
jgi:hypothetical protein